jgi:hypothetical protein
MAQIKINTLSHFLTWNYVYTYKEGYRIWTCFHPVSTAALELLIQMYDAKAFLLGNQGTLDLSSSCSI